MSSYGEKQSSLSGRVRSAYGLKADVAEVVELRPYGRSAPGQLTQDVLVSSCGFDQSTLVVVPLSNSRIGMLQHRGSDPNLIACEIGDSVDSAITKQVRIDRGAKFSPRRLRNDRTDLNGRFDPYPTTSHPNRSQIGAR
jgi:hypothetical protein